MRRSLMKAAVIPAGVLLLSACSQPAENTDGPVENLSIATGGTSGVYYPIGGVLATIIESEFEGHQASVEATGASVENLRLLDSGDAHMALVQGDSADQAITGTADFEGEEIRTRTLAVLYPNVFHAVTLDSTAESEGYECFSDVVGTRYSVGDIGSGNETTTNQVFESLGIGEDDIEMDQLGYSETATALQNGRLDAGSWVVGEGHAGIVELGTTDDIDMISMCEEELDQVVEGEGGYTEHTIEAGTYPGVDEDVTTVATWNALVVPEDFDEDQAYEITEAVFDNIDDVVGAYAPGEEYMVPETVENAPVPVHPGAQRYYEEQGVELSEDIQG
ncbi:TAXI family TRAP transporter solute-binding subunit [Nocardiopsis kunsanensis]|uniref:C4-dicarboxylate ABC transporter substrate-binding protein n=1 Tax=Nocardiopsis kunsanensis TaxID=141693 RepID=A0A918XG81_9ACTN|nr:TAXI family TRAP transporter solute-binding subunit [Nocardiopsis kunsanensis]GHD30632.1 C4-dicarboxylate ABC transporter substrate-binding protein [Nocardiopsis kunsanensis]